MLRSMQNNETDMLPILRTDTQRDLLIELFFRSSRPRTLSDLARAIDVDQTTVMREVNRLLASGVVVDERVGRARTISINERSPLARPLRELISVALQPTDADDHTVIDIQSRRATQHPVDNRPDARPLPSSRRQRS